MVKFYKNIHGFSIITLILGMVVLILLVLSGWYIYRTAHEPKTNAPIKTLSTNKTKSQTQQTSTTSSKTYFTIPQWGVRAPYSGSLTLEYSVSSGSDPSTTNLSSAQLDASDPNCKNNPKYGGMFERFPASDIVINPNKNSSGVTSQNSSSQANHGNNWIKIGNYYYWYIPVKGFCGSTKSSELAQMQTIYALGSILTSLQPIPQ